MPRKSKARQAAANREQEKKEASLQEYHKTQRYRPSNPFCIPYWDAYYENPYPNQQQCEEIALRLGNSVSTIQRWFREARRFTHAPEREPEEVPEERNCNSLNAAESDLEDLPAEGEIDEDSFNDLGSLYAHFYHVNPQTGVVELSPQKASKRKQSDIGGPPAVKKPRNDGTGPTVKHRGPYTKASRTTIWRNRKHASDIRGFFPSVNQGQSGAEANGRRMQGENGPLPSKPPAEVIELLDESDSEEATHIGTSGALSQRLGQETSLTATPNEIPDKPPSITATRVPDSSESAGATEMCPDIPIGIDAQGSPASGHPADYQMALSLLENSLDRLKVQVSGEPTGSGIGSSSGTSPNQCKMVPDPPDCSAESGPVPISVHAEIQASTALLDAEEPDQELSYYETLNRHLQRLLNEEKTSKTPSLKKLLELTVLSDYNVLRESLRQQGCSSPSTTASTRIASCKVLKPPRNKRQAEDSWYSRQIRSKAAHIMRFGTLPESAQGKGAKHHSLLSNEDVRHSILAYIRSLEVGQITPVQLKREVNRTILPTLGISSQISDSTALRWLQKLGYHSTEHRKGVYVDGHERSDVLEYRKRFLDIIKSLEPLIQQYDDETDEPLPLVLPEGEKRHVPVAHDESCFHANDQQKTIWLRDDEQQLRQKSKGRVIHVSDFIVEESGRLALSQRQVEANSNKPQGEQLQVTDARKIIEPGKNNDDWWNLAQLCEQLQDAIKIFDHLYPGCVGVFFFDQSSAHNA